MLLLIAVAVISACISLCGQPDVGMVPPKQNAVTIVDAVLACYAVFDRVWCHQ